MQLNRSILSIGIIAVVLASCSNGSVQTESEKKDFLAANLDTTVSPGEDFFLYANGGWIKKTTIPAAESMWGVGDLVQEDIYARLKKINDDAAALSAVEACHGKDLMGRTLVVNEARPMTQREGGERRPPRR